jgi:hypothetical protein
MVQLHKNKTLSVDSMHVNMLEFVVGLQDEGYQNVHGQPLPTFSRLTPS